MIKKVYKADKQNSNHQLTIIIIPPHLWYGNITVLEATNKLIIDIKFKKEYIYLKMCHTIKGHLLLACAHNKGNISSTKELFLMIRYRDVISWLKLNS